MVGSKFRIGDLCKSRLISFWRFIYREGAHVHFQLSIEPPDTHDMPGAVTLEDRPKALVKYPDPRYVLGMLY